MKANLDQPGGLSAYLKELAAGKAELTPGAKIFRRLLQDMDVTKDKWGGLMDAYMQRHYPDATGATESALRTQLVRELMDPQMDMDAFAKGLDLLKVQVREVFSEPMPDSGLLTLSIGFVYA